MRFEYEKLLLLLLLVPAAAAFFALAGRRRRKLMLRFASAPTLARIRPGASDRRRALRSVLMLAAMALLILAAARPQYGTVMEEVKRKGIDLVIAVDTSSSMLAQDIKPNRLEKAKQEIGGLLRRMKGDRVALVAFAGEPFVLCPLTLDYGAAQLFLDILDTQTIPTPGTAIGKAIDSAVSAFETNDRKHKVILLLTDGEDLAGEPVKAAERAAQAGARIYTIGIGSPEGELIPAGEQAGEQGTYKKDSEGKLIQSRLDETTLQKMALLTDGKYYRATLGEMELDRVYDEISKMDKKELTSKSVTRYKDRFQWFLIPALVLLLAEGAISDRRRHKAETRGRFEEAAGGGDEPDVKNA